MIFAKSISGVQVPYLTVWGLQCLAFLTAYSFSCVKFWVTKSSLIFGIPRCDVSDLQYSHSHFCLK